MILISNITEVCTMCNITPIFMMYVSNVYVGHVHGFDNEAG